MIVDKRLKKAIKKNDRRMILQLYRYSYDKIMSIATRYYVNEEDRITIVNNSFMKIIGNIDQFRIGSSYFSWVSRIVYNEIISSHRKDKKRKSLFNFESFDIMVQKHSESEVVELDWISEVDLLKLIAELPKATRIVFDMYAIEGGYTYKEVSDCLDISTETVKWHLKQARKILKGKIKNYKLSKYA
ncbi:MAG: RNA polymerase sigma factor (sigma-70 family) [Crocinitomix sp.]|jgi:RNA polymerase sigma factor (sigma-70 family)